MKTDSRATAIVVIVLAILCKKAYAPAPKVEYWFKFLNDDDPRLGTIQTEAQSPGGVIRILSKNFPTGATGNLVNLFAAKKSDTRSKSYATAPWMHLIGTILRLSESTKDEYVFTFERFKASTFFILHENGRTLFQGGRSLAVLKSIPNEKFKREIQIEGTKSQIDQVFQSWTAIQSSPTAIQILRLINPFNYKENTFPLPAVYACGPFEFRQSKTDNGEAVLTVIAGWLTGGENSFGIHTIRIQGKEKKVLGGYLVLNDSPKSNVFEVRVRDGSYSQAVKDLQKAKEDGRPLMISAPMTESNSSEDFLKAPMKLNLFGVQVIEKLPDVRRGGNKECVHVTFQSLSSIRKLEKDEGVHAPQFSSPEGQATNLKQEVNDPKKATDDFEDNSSQPIESKPSLSPESKVNDSKTMEQASAPLTESTANIDFDPYVNNDSTPTLKPAPPQSNTTNVSDDFDAITYRHGRPTTTAR